MAANGSQSGVARLYPNLHAPSYCAHDRAREIRMYMPYAEANAIRLAWTLCNECPPHDARREAVAE